MLEPKLAVIGGTGVYDPSMLENVSCIDVDTPFGPVRAQTGVLAGKRVDLLPEK